MALSKILWDTLLLIYCHCKHQNIQSSASDKDVGHHREVSYYTSNLIVTFINRVLILANINKFMIIACQQMAKICLCSYLKESNWNLDYGF